MVTAPTPTESFKFKVPLMPMLPPVLDAATFRAASDVKSSVPVAANEPVPKEPYVKLTEPDIDMSPADAHPAVKLLL